MERLIVALLFSDIAGYSDLSEPQFRVFIEKILPDISELLDDAREDFIELNTWGDALVIASKDPYNLARFSLNLRDFYKNRNWLDDHLPIDLSARIALHSGVIFTGADPIRQTNGIVGTQVNLAARIEPVTTPGEVWVTEQFMGLIDPKTDTTIAFDDLGERPLAKKFGSTRLFRLRRSHESSPTPRDVQVETVKGPATSKELELAMHMAKHGSNAQKILALEILGEFDTSESIEVLLEVARDQTEDHRLRLRSLYTLEKLRSRIAIPDIITIAENQEEPNDITGYAVDVLGETRDIRALPVLESILLGNRKLEGRVLAAALGAIAKIGDPGGIPVLSKMFDNMENYLPILPNLVAACAVLPDSSFVEPLQSIVRSSDSYSLEIRMTALSALTLNSPTQSEQLFIELAQNENEYLEVREKAIIALASVPSNRSKQVLENLASDLSNPVSGLALGVLVKGPKLVKRAKESFLSQVKQGSDD